MPTEVTTVTLNIMGREIPIQCPKNKIAELQESARHLEEKMQLAREDNKLMSTDKIAMITAINVMHAQLYQNPLTPNITKRISTLAKQIQDELETKM